MDVKTIFLHGDLEEENYMKQLRGFPVKGTKNNRYLLGVGFPSYGFLG
jgi:hypothetical protein